MWICQKKNIALKYTVWTIIKIISISDEEYLSAAPLHTLGFLRWPGLQKRGSKDPIVSSRRVLKSWGTFDVHSMTSVRITSIGLVLNPSTTLCRYYLEHCPLTNNVLGTPWRVCLNLIGGERVLILVLSDCSSGLLETKDLIPLLDWSS